MINITTGYPLRTGDAQKDFELLYSSFCSLVDELSYAIPTISGQVTPIADDTESKDEGV